jgi:hypothetical protein
MNDPNSLLALLVLTVIALAMLSLAVLRGWNGWLELRRLEISQARAPASNPATARIELATLRDRIRRLEAIATGLEE